MFSSRFIVDASLTIFRRINESAGNLISVVPILLPGNCLLKGMCLQFR